MSVIHSLIYVSAARGETPDAELDSILAAARRNNEAAEVTGLLLFHDNSFFQVLEGPPDGVSSIFAKIEKDARHSRIIRLQSGEASERAFPNWSMGYVQPHALNAAQTSNLIDLRYLVGREEPATLSSSPAVSVQINAFLRSFREFAVA